MLSLVDTLWKENGMANKKLPRMSFLGFKWRMLMTLFPETQYKIIIVDPFCYLVIYTFNLQGLLQLFNVLAPLVTIWLIDSRLSM